MSSIHQRVGGEEGFEFFFSIDIEFVTNESEVIIWIIVNTNPCICPIGFLISFGTPTRMVCSLLNGNNRAYSGATPQLQRLFGFARAARRA